MLTPDEEENRLLRAEVAAPVPTAASSVSTRFLRRFSSSPRAMRPKRSPRRKSRESRRPNNHFHQLQQEQNDRPQSSFFISALVDLSFVAILTVEASVPFSTALDDCFCFSLFSESSE